MGWYISNMFMSLAGKKKWCSEVARSAILFFFFLPLLACQKFIGASFFYWRMNCSIGVFELACRDFPYGKA